MPAKLSPAMFVERAQSVHNFKYEYPDVVLLNGVHSKVPIVCPIHGSFEQKANDHLRGSGCFKCKPNYPKSSDTIVNEAKGVHGNKFVYDASTINGMMKKMRLTCTECNHVFFQTPNDHINHQAGCPQCVGHVKLTTEGFIQRARDVHGDRYNYSHVECDGVHSKVKIGCDTHGTFTQTPRHHLYGQGCPSCRMSAGENIVYAWLTKNNIAFIHQHRFSNCVSNTSRQLPFDFWLPAHNILLEVDGEQHHKPNKLFNRTMSFERIQHHDSIKNEYAARNSIKMVRIVSQVPAKMIPQLEKIKEEMTA